MYEATSVLNASLSVWQKAVGESVGFDEGLAVGESVGVDVVGDTLGLAVGV